jgi:hypothetical protein
MPILYGAVAYREDQIPKFEQEIASWELQRVYEHPIACPKGGACDKTYRLILEVNTSDETTKEYVGMVLRAMERGCDVHSPRIRINPPS